MSNKFWTRTHRERRGGINALSEATTWAVFPSPLLRQDSEKGPDQYCRRLDEAASRYLSSSPW